MLQYKTLYKVPIISFYFFSIELILDWCQPWCVHNVFIILTLAVNQKPNAFFKMGKDINKGVRFPKVGVVLYCFPDGKTVFLPASFTTRPEVSLISGVGIWQMGEARLH